MRSNRLLITLLVLLASLALYGQQHPNVRKGFAVDGAYQMGDIDNVNMFNGNLVVQIPIGQRFPVGGTLSYGFTLTYNSKVWDLENAGFQYLGKPAMRVEPSHRSNAGLGWLLSFGRILDVDNPANKSGALVYESPDGSEHRIYCTLHADEEPTYDCHDDALPIQVPPPLVQGYTRDATYIRMRAVPHPNPTTNHMKAARIEFPDGSSHLFEDDDLNRQMRIIEMDDRFGNWVKIGYSADDLTWTITDSIGRTHVVKFEKTPTTQSQTNYKTRLASIELATWNSGSARSAYQFDYDENLQTTRGCVPSYYNLEPLTGGEPRVPLLNKITIPAPAGETQTYTFRYYGTHANCGTGGISRLTLPTGGLIEYDYRRYIMPTSVCTKDAVLNETGGVATRTVSDTVRGLKYKSWTYTTTPVTADSNADSCPVGLGSPIPITVYKYLENAVATPTGETITHFFSIWPKQSASSEGYLREEYALPFARSFKSSDGRFLSTSTQFNGSLKSKTFVTYELDPKPQDQLIPSMNPDRNRRVKGTRIEYSDDSKHADTAYDDFDGLGHYRKTVLDGNFTGTNDRTVVTNYNPGRALPSKIIPGTTLYEPTLPHTAEWLLETYPSRSVTDTLPNNTTSVLKSEFCFNATSGFLEARRTLKGATASSNDLLVTFEHDGHGNVKNEKYFGGDVVTTSASGCAPGNEQPTYQIAQVWDAGVLKSSGFTGSGFLNVDNDIDKNTGLVTHSRDASGIQTDFAYDVLGRVKTVTPPSGNGPIFRYTYGIDSSPKVEVVATGTKVAKEVGRKFVRFDSLGRPWLELSRMPESGRWSIRRFDYDALNRQTRVSQPQEYTQDPTNAGNSFTGQHGTSFEYDWMGRQTKVTPPDGAAHAVTHDFDGVSQDVETVKRSNGSSQAERSASTTRIFDRFGRLATVKEFSQSTSATRVKGTETSTDYTYDAGDRLTSAKTTGDGATQTRTFTYDARGFLTKETHPETTSDTVYSKFDSRGHATQRTFAGKTLTFDYDDAERLKEVRDSQGILKKFDFATANNGSDKRQGKLVQTRRRNDLAAGQFDVTESYSYTGAAGQMSSRTTLVEKVNGTNRTAIQSFTYGVTYDDTLQPEEITMPTCTGCPTSDGIAKVTNVRDEGYLTSVTGYGSMTYHPNGMVESVEHDTNNKPTDLYATSNNMARPSRITFAGCKDLTPYFLPGSVLVKPTTSGSSCALQVTWPPAVTCGSGAGIKYRVLRDGADVSGCLTGPPLKFIDTNNLQPNVAYTYSVVAEGPQDDAGRGSCQHGLTKELKGVPVSFKSCEAETILTTSKVTASVGIPASFEATLSSPNGPVQDEELIFIVNNREIGRARTGLTGVAIVRAAIDTDPGTYPNAIVVTYAGGILPAKSVTADLVVACNIPAYSVKPIRFGAPQEGTPAGRPYDAFVNTSVRCHWQPMPEGFPILAPLDRRAGSGKFTLAVPANPTTADRTAKPWIQFDFGVQFLTVDQAGIGCSYHFSPELSYFPAESSFATATVNVSTGPACEWTVASDQSWVNISSPQAGHSVTGPGSVTFTIADNPNPAKRVAHLVLNGNPDLSGSINQNALPPAECPQMVYDLRGGSVSNGRYIPLRVYVKGTQLKYQWFVNDRPLPECNSGPNCSQKLLQPGDSGYPAPGQSSSFQVEVYNSCGHVASQSVTWSNNTPPSSTCHVPTITDSLFRGPTQTPGDGLSPYPGFPVTYIAIGNDPDNPGGPVQYQWYHGLPGDEGSKVANGTSDMVTVSPFDTSFYWLKVTNACGDQWSRSGGVFVTPAPKPGKIRAVPHDFNRDGRTDVLWHNPTSGANEVWTMTGTSHTGTVSLPASTAASGQMQSIGDFNGDEKPDIVWRNPQTGNNEVWIMNGTSLNGIAPLEARSGAAWTIGAVADFDDDGGQDIVWHNAATGANELWFQNDTEHNGTWALPSSGKAGVYGTGDFNGDQKPDLFLFDRGTGASSIWLMDDAERGQVAGKVTSVGGMHDLRTATLSLPAMTDPGFEPAEVADFDGDGKPDILWRNPTTGENKVWVMAGTTVSQTVNIESRTDPDWEIGGGGSNNEGDTTPGGGGTPGSTATAITVTVDPAALGQPTAVTATLTAGTTPVAQRLLIFSRSGNEFARMNTDTDGSATAVVDVSDLPAGRYTGAITVRFEGDATYNASTASADIVINGQTASVDWSNPAPIVYGTPLSAAQLNATATVPGSFVYDPPAGTVLEAGYRTLSVTFTPADASIPPVTRTAVVLVTKAASSVTWSAPALIAYGKPLSAAQLNATSTLEGTYEYDPDAGTLLPVGVQTLHVTFTPDSPNYEPSSTSTTITVEKGRQLIVWSDPAPISALVPLGAAQLNARVLPSGPAPGGAVTYDPPAGTLLPPGQHELRVSVAATDSYDAAAATVDLSVFRLTPTLTWSNPAAIVYGTPLSAAQLNATASVAGTFEYDPPAGTIFNAGSEQLSVVFTPSDSRYEPVSATVSLQVLKAQQSISWAKPAAIVYGTPLSATQLNATIQVSGPAPAGALVYTPAEGTVLQAGPAQVLSVISPATDNYDAATATVTIDVLKANPVITWPAPAGIVYGTPLSATQLNATADVPGTFTYTPPAGTILNAGAGQTLSAHFTPADPANYNSADAARTIDVAKAKQTLSWTPPAPIVYGTALSSAQLNATVSVVGPSPAGALTYTPAAGTVLDAGLGLTLTVTAAETANYEPATLAVKLDVHRAPLSLTVDAKSKLYGAPLPALTGTLTGVVNHDPITPSYATTATQQSGAGTYPITGSLNDPNHRLPNYDVTIAPATLAILPAPLTISANAATKQYSDPLPTLTATYTGFVLGETPAVLSGTLVIQTAAVATSGPGTYPITIGGVSSPNYAITFVGSTLTVTPEDARVTITAPALLSAAASGPTTVTLSATVRDISATADAAGDSSPGDIRKATLTFVDRTTAATLCTAPIGLVTAGDERTGIVTCSFTRDFGTALPASVTVGAVVSGYYTRDAAADDLTLTVGTPTIDRIVGAGQLAVASAAGPYAPEASSDPQFEFQFDYDKDKAVHANFRLQFTRTESGEKHRYDLTVDSASSLAILRTPAGGQATIVAAGTLVDATTKQTIVSGAPFVITATDNGNGNGSSDQFGVTLFKPEGGIWLATGWNGVQTVEQPLRSGQIGVGYGK